MTEPTKRERLLTPIPPSKQERIRLDRKVVEEKKAINKVANGRQKANAKARFAVSPRSGASIPAGRPKGTPNRTTAMLRQIIFMAGELEGSNQKGKDGLLGYVRALARYEKKTYVTLLAKCLPQRIQADLDPASLIARMMQTAAATRSAREGQQNGGPMIDVTPSSLPRPKP
jgi:hypothetical protein